MSQHLKLLICLIVVQFAMPTHRGVSAKDSESKSRILVVVGPSNHPPGSHEVAAGGRLIEHCIEQAKNISGFEADIVYGWPKDKQLLAATDSVVFIDQSNQSRANRNS